MCTWIERILHAPSIVCGVVYSQNFVSINLGIDKREWKAILIRERAVFIAIFKIDQATEEMIFKVRKKILMFNEEISSHDC